MIVAMEKIIFFFEIIFVLSLLVGAALIVARAVERNLGKKSTGNNGAKRRKWRRTSYPYLPHLPSNVHYDG